MSRAISTALPEHLIARRAAQRREVNTQLVACVLAIVCFAGAGALLSPINVVRKERQLVIDPRSIAGLPPDIALIGKLGAFRALAIDWAAIRAERMKQEGRDYEALQLHETVCALAPRFPRIWVYAAWNMAYNISVSQYSPEARWQWVRNGIEILRDKAIKYNPRAISLYKELAWIYWHKIGDFLDDEHMNYKRVLGVDMERVLGPPPVTPTTEEYLAWFRRIVEASQDVDALLRSDAEVKAVAERLRGVGLPPDASLLEFVARNVRPELRASDLIDTDTQAATPLSAQLAVINDPDAAPALGRLLSALRRRELTEKYKLDVEFMYQLMAEQYGPLDWRNAFSHSLYWSSYGDKIAKGYAATDPSEAMQTARFILYSLQQLITKGRITLYPNFEKPFGSYIDFSPDTRFIPYLFEAYLRIGKDQFADEPGFEEGTPGKRFMTGLVSSVHSWIQLLYFEGGDRNVQLAENFYTWLRQNNPHPDGRTQERYLVPLEEFVMAEVVDQMNTWRSASAITRSLVQRSLKQYALGQARSGDISMQRAKKCYDIWMRDTKQDLNDRRKLQSPLIILRDEIYVFMEDKQIDPLFKARLWKNLPELQRQMVFDRLHPALEQLCGAQEPPWLLRKAFPEPPDMAAFRKGEAAQIPSEPETEQGERFRQ